MYKLLLLLLLLLLKGFRKLVIVFLTSKNTSNLINLSLFLKHKNEVKTVNWQKLKNKKPTNVYKTKPCSIKLPTTSSTQPKLPHVPIKKTTPSSYY